MKIDDDRLNFLDVAIMNINNNNKLKFDLFSISQTYLFREIFHIFTPSLTKKSY